MKTFTQKKAGRVLKFDFNDDGFTYDMNLHHTKSVRSYEYPNVTSQTSEFTEKNEWFRNAGILWIVIGIVQTVLILKQGRLDIPFWLVLGLVCVAVYYFRQITFTVIEATGANVLIIKDAQHDEIFKALFDARKEYFRKTYAKVSLENVPEYEISRFKYLLKEKIITEDEFNAAKEKIEQHHKSKPVPSIGFM